MEDLARTVYPDMVNPSEMDLFLAGLRYCREVAKAPLTLQFAYVNSHVKSWNRLISEPVDEQVLVLCLFTYDKEEFDNRPLDEDVKMLEKALGSKATWWELKWWMECILIFFFVCDLLLTLFWEAGNLCGRWRSTFNHKHLTRLGKDEETGIVCSSLCLVAEIGHAFPPMPSNMARLAGHRDTLSTAVHDVREYMERLHRCACATFLRLSEPPRCFTVSKDELWLADWHTPGRMHVWDFSADSITLQLAYTLPSPCKDEQILAAAFDAQRDTFSAVSESGTIWAWDVLTRTCSHDPIVLQGFIHISGANLTTALETRETYRLDQKFPRRRPHFVLGTTRPSRSLRRDTGDRSSRFRSRPTANTSQQQHGAVVNHVLISNDRSLLIPGAEDGTVCIRKMKDVLSRKADAWGPMARRIFINFVHGSGERA
ncbi:hypothetical protein C8Q80DRAFT_1265560 [Daedaleopsis nitida]|nr:hypothetical protein C8Q80DRAFT_1265560 [Daedaleopsis nitida]